MKENQDELACSLCQQIVDSCNKVDPFYRDIYGDACITKGEAYRDLVCIRNDQHKYYGLTEYCEEAIKAYKEGELYGGFREPQDIQFVHTLYLTSILNDSLYERPSASKIIDEVSVIDEHGEWCKQIYKEHYSEYYDNNARVCDSRTIFSYFTGIQLLDQIHAPVNQIDGLINKVKQLIENNTSLSQEDILNYRNMLPKKAQQYKDNRGCYIATCVYHSYDCPEVWTFRRFRDIALSQRVSGRLFIHFYYSISPKLVSYLGDNKVLVKYTKKLLDYLYKTMMMYGYSNEAYTDK